MAQAEGDILDLQEHMGRLECFWFMSQICEGMCRPSLSEESLIIMDGWHLLLGKDAIENHSFSYNHTEGRVPARQVYNS